MRFASVDEWFDVSVDQAEAAIREAVSSAERGNLTASPVREVNAVEPPVEWERRASASSLTRQTLAFISGVTEPTVDRQLAGAWPLPRYVKALILAWEIMTPEQRLAWIEAVEREAAGSTPPPPSQPNKPSPRYRGPS